MVLIFFPLQSVIYHSHSLTHTHTTTTELCRLTVTLAWSISNPWLQETMVNLAALAMVVNQPAHWSSFSGPLNLLQDSLSLSLFFAGWLAAASLSFSLSLYPLAHYMAQC